MAVEVFGNLPTTTVSSGGTDAPPTGTQQTWTVASSTGFPAVSSSATPPTQIHIADIALNSEIISVINISGTTWTVIRGAESTTPVAHAAGFTIYQVVSAGGYAQLRAVDWLNVVTQFGADNTGSADCTSAIQAAVSAMPASGGVIYFPAGTYRVNSTVTCTQPGVYFQGDTKWASVIQYYGSGDCIRMYSTTLTTPNGVYGGGVKGLMIDGTNASAGAAGLHFGDIFHPEFDVMVRDFQGTGSKGVWFDNQYHWTEQILGQIFAEQCTSHVVFDNSANPNGGATGSFDRAVLDVFVDAKGKGNLVVWQNGANCYDGRIGIYGNTDYGSSLFYVLSLLDNPALSFTATNASPCVFTAAGWYFGNGTPVILSGSPPTGFIAGTTYFVVNVNVGAGTFQLAATSGGTAINSSSTGSGTVKSSSYARIVNSVLNIGVECNGTSGTQPGTINFADSAILSTCIQDCTGIIDFSANNAFVANATNWTSNFQFDGPVYGDSHLMACSPLGRVPFSVGAIVTGGTITTRFNAFATVAPAANVTGILMSRDFSSNWRELTVINTSNFTLTFDVPANSFVADGTSDVIQANSAATYTWSPSATLWYRTGAPQNYLGMFGTGSDGSATLDGSATVAWASKSGSVYTQTREAHLTSLTINAGVTLKTQSFRLFCQGTVTIASTGVMSNTGGNASAGSGGGGAGGSASFPGGRTGGNGGTGVSGAGAAGSAASIGSAGGAGGAGTSGSAGAGGTTTVSTANAGANVLVTPYVALAGVGAYAFNTVELSTGSGGGGGGSDASSNAGGGGGGGGGTLAVFAWALVNNGSITVAGGNGANGAAGNAGGGGGGAGGLILIYTLTAVSGSGSTSVAGGTHGNGSGTGSAGSDGGAGLLVTTVVQ